MKSAALLKLTAATALCVVLLASCASNSKFYEANGSGFVGPGFFSTNIYEPSNSNFYDIYNLSQRDSETIRIFKSEFNQVNYLQEQIKQGIDCEKNEQELKKMRDYLVQNCKERVLKRINLLRAFYTDLSALNNDDFLKKHRKHCSKGFLKKMKKLSEEKNNYDWTLFYSRETCSPKDIKYNYANKDPFSTSKKKELYVLFPFYNTENRWIEVMMGNQSIWVKVDGEGKHVAITGIVNADKKIEIETALDR